MKEAPLKIKTSKSSGLVDVPLPDGETPEQVWLDGIEQRSQHHLIDGIEKRLDASENRYFKMERFFIAAAILGVMAVFCQLVLQSWVIHRMRALPASGAALKVHAAEVIRTELAQNTKAPIRIGAAVTIGLSPDQVEKWKNSTDIISSDKGNRVRGRVLASRQENGQFIYIVNIKTNDGSTILHEKPAGWMNILPDLT